MSILQLPVDPLGQTGFIFGNFDVGASVLRENELQLQAAAAVAATPAPTSAPTSTPTIAPTPNGATSTPSVSYASFAESALNVLTNLFNAARNRYGINPRENVYTPTTTEIKRYETAFIDVADQFNISQLDEEGNILRTFKFALLPAIESSINGKQVPEVKPGILKKSTMNIKTFNLPGGIPAFQVLGLTPSILQLVGLLVGAEQIEDLNSTIASNYFNNTTGSNQLYTANSKLNASGTAKYLEEKFIQVGRPVQIDLITNNSSKVTPNFDSTLKLSYKALVQNIRFFIAKQDRVYYSIEALTLDYPLISTDALFNNGNNNNNPGTAPATPIKPTQTPTTTVTTPATSTSPAVQTTTPN